jgi:hypothetical protein
MSYRFGGEAQEPGERDNGDGIHGEDEARRHAVDLAHDNADGYKDQ